MARAVFHLAAILALVVGVLLTPDAHAQHPIDVERSAANGEYFGALVAFERMPTRRSTTSSIIAAAQSAWALGLADRARTEFDRALRDQSLSADEQVRLVLSRGIVEYQEGNYKLAALYAERSVNQNNVAGPLRSNAWALWGQALLKEGAYGLAEQKLLRSLDESMKSERTERHFLVAQCQLHLGKTTQARSHLEQVSLDSDSAPWAMRYLAQIALDERKPSEVRFWLTQGRQRYPERFIDSWVDYALVSAAVSEGNAEQAEILQTEANKRYPPSDFWLNLLQAVAESYYWARRSAPSHNEGVL